MALTRRGRRVRAVIRFIFWTLVIFGVLWIVGEITTPETCKVELENMSEFCKELRFP